MNWERMQLQLAQILNTRVRIKTLSEKQWEAIAASSGQAEGLVEYATHQGVMYWMIRRESGMIVALCVDQIVLSESERQLIAVTVELASQLERKPKQRNATEDEVLSSLLQEWILEAIEQGRGIQELPESIKSQPAMQATRVPFLLQDSFSGNQSVSYKELKKLLESFFEEEVLLIPLKEREWLILSSDQIVHAADQEDRNGDPIDSVEDTLESISSGLHEMIATEWLGECKLAVNYPIVPAKSLLASIVQLREAVYLGSTFHLGSSIHFPWRLHLERLLYHITDEEKKSFLENVLHRTDYFTDAEMLPTLEHFFALDCNVSDTAKQLYIHRNTLLYRLDKFKQETGLDVRNFRDAVLVRIALLLYKVTKR